MLAESRPETATGHVGCHSFARRVVACVYDSRSARRLGLRSCERASCDLVKQSAECGVRSVERLSLRQLRGAGAVPIIGQVLRLVIWIMDPGQPRHRLGTGDGKGTG